MTRIQLRLYVDPGEAEITVNVRLKDQTFERVTATIDTGAETSMLPLYLLDRLDFRPDKETPTIVEQAGIARQVFEVTTGYVTIDFEDAFGNKTAPFEIPVWFAETEMALIGFAGVLDRAILHMDMINRDGWLEIND